MRAKRCLKLCGNTLYLDTLALSQSAFIIFHIVLLSSGFPVFVTNTEPLVIFWVFAYSVSILQSSLGKITILILPLQLIVAFLNFTASTVTYCNSDTLITLEHIVCINKYNLWLLFAFAASSNLSYTIEALKTIGANRYVDLLTQVIDEYFHNVSLPLHDEQIELMYDGINKANQLIWKNEGPAYDELHKAIVRHITEKLNNPNNIY